MLRFYIIVSLLCFVVIVNSINLLLRRFSSEFEWEYKFSEFLFSTYGFQFLILSFMPLFNLLLAVLLVFYQDRAYNSLLLKLAERYKKQFLQYRIQHVILSIGAVFYIYIDSYVDMVWQIKNDRIWRKLDECEDS